MSAYTRRLVNETENIIRNDPALLQDIQQAANQADPAELAKAIRDAIDKASKELQPWTTDRLLYRIAISVLSLLALLAALAACYTMVPVPDGTTVPIVPESLVALGSAAAGALVGLFAKPPSSSPASSE